MMKYTNCTSSVIVASVANTNTGTNYAETTAPADLTTGAIGYLVNGQSTTDALGNIITSAEDGKFVWKNRAGKIVYSDTIDISQLTTTDTNQLAIKTAYAAPAAQVTYIGYNGTSGSINLVDSCPYELTLYMKNSSITAGHIYNAYPKHVGGFVSSMDATQEEIALAVAYSGYKQFKDEKVMKVQFDAICNATVTAANGTKTGQEVTVVRGSNVLTFETDVTYTAGGGSTLAVGDYLRLGTVGGGTALTSAVYKVTAISTVYVTVDRPITNASGTYDDVGGTSDIEIIPSATGLAANWGVRMVGIELFASTYGIETTNYWSIDGRMEYDVNTFTIAYYSGFTTDTAITYTTAASKGNGTYWEVSEEEYFAQGFDGKFIYTGYPAYLFTPNTVAGYTYTKYYFYWYDAGSTSPVLGDTVKQPRALTVYIPSGDTTSISSMDTGF